MTQEWKDYALHLRQILVQCGVETPQCLPGEPQDCGNDFAHHCLGYLAMLKAKADDGLWHMHHGESEAAHTAEVLYEHWRKELTANHDCERCRPRGNE